MNVKKQPPISPSPGGRSLLNFSHSSSAASQTGPASLILIGPLLSLFDRCSNFIGCHRTYFLAILINFFHVIAPLIIEN